jgi:hypothetical protein
MIDGPRDIKAVVGGQKMKTLTDERMLLLDQSKITDSIDDSKSSRAHPS